MIDETKSVEVQTKTDYSKGIRIDIPYGNSITRKLINTKERFIVLYEKFVTYKIISVYETNDTESGLWETRKANYRFTRMREDILDVDMFYDNTEDFWTVSICFVREPHITVDYETPKDALNLYNTLQTYFITR